MNRLHTLSTVLCALLLLGALAGCGNDNGTLNVTTMQAKAADTLSGTDYMGTVHASVSMSVIPNISGKVTKVYVALGQQVQAGTPLMELDTADAALTLKQAKASLDSAQANYEKIANAGNRQSEAQSRQALTTAENELRDATTNYDTVKSQYDSGVSVAPAQSAFDSAQGEYDRISFLVSMGEESDYGLTNAKNALDTAAAQLANAKDAAQTAMNNADSRLKNAKSAYQTAQENYKLTVGTVNPENVKAARASVETARISVEVAQKHINDSVIKASTDGTISAVNVTEGDMASPQAEAFHLLAGEGMQVEAYITESAATQLTIEMPATVTLTSSGETRNGTISELSPMADATTGMYLVKVNLPTEETEGLKDGMQAGVRFAGPEDDRVLVPQKSVLEEDGDSYVYVVREGTAVRTPITVETPQGAYYAVTGLETGADVIYQGIDRVSDGVTVHIVANTNQ